jgi:XTP/dITP diphosphohydrolase
MSTRPRRWVAATANVGKLRELKALLAPLGIELVGQQELAIRPAPEPAPTFVENALCKARHAAAASGLPALADDSGLMVDALGGAPGVRSARFAGPSADDTANIAKLLDALVGTPAAERGAHFCCVMVTLAAADDPAPLVATGTWFGVIAASPRGENGFGYDPVFLDAATGLSAAELSAEQKNARSHRAQALAELARQLALRRSSTVMHSPGEH